MNSTFCQWLEDVEEAFWRMIRGVFRFVFHRLPEAFYRWMVDAVGPVTIRLIRVLVVFSLWLAVLFGPATTASKLNLPFSGWIGFAWVVLAIIGSGWGLSYIAKKRRAIAA